ncbi:hypothetical protein RJ639_014562, partial [Escallonia herrerae]
DRARRRKEEEENKVEREREKDRTRAGKQLLEAKRVEEENERKRSATDIKSPLYTSYEALGYSSFLALRKVEKEEERRARDKIRQKLEMDKLERRSRLKLHPEDLSSSRPATSVKPEKEDSIPVNSPMVPVNFGRKPELMRDCLRSLKRKHKEDDAKVRKAFHTLLIYVKNVARNPDEEKFRKIRLSNPAFQDRVGAFEEGTEFLELCGFERVGDKFLHLPKDKVDMEAYVKSSLTLWPWQQENQAWFDNNWGAVFNLAPSKLIFLITYSPPRHQREALFPARHPFIHLQPIYAGSDILIIQSLHSFTHFLHKSIILFILQLPHSCSRKASNKLLKRGPRCHAINKLAQCGLSCCHGKHGTRTITINLKAATVFQGWHEPPSKKVIIHEQATKSAVQPLARFREAHLVGWRIVESHRFLVRYKAQTTWLTLCPEDFLKRVTIWGVFCSLEDCSVTPHS